MHLEGCTVEDGALVGTGAVVLHRCVIGAGALVGAGAVVPNDMQVPPIAMALGVPGQAPARRGAAGDDRRHVATTTCSNARRYRKGLRLLD